MVDNISSIQNFNAFQIKDNLDVKLDQHPREWAGRIVTCLNSWDGQIDALFPTNLHIQNAADELVLEIKERFAPLVEFNQWLEKSGHGNWHVRLAESLIKLPIRSARNVVSYLYAVISNILYTGVHPLKGLNHIAKSMVVLLDEMTKPENWAKIGCGSMGALAGQSLILGNPLSLIGLAIGGAAIAAGLSIDALDAAIRCERGEELKMIGARLWTQVKQTPETLLTGLFMGMLIGGIRRATQSAEKPMEIKEKTTSRKPMEVEKKSSTHKPIEIKKVSTSREFKKVDNVAQYKGSDWKNHIKTMHNMTLEEAKAFANQNDNVDYFFYMKGGFCLEIAPPQHQHWGPGDAAFFSGEPWWGSAGGAADGYIKI